MSAKWRKTRGRISLSNKKKVNYESNTVDETDLE